MKEISDFFNKRSKCTSMIYLLQSKLHNYAFSFLLLPTLMNLLIDSQNRLRYLNNSLHKTVAGTGLDLVTEESASYKQMSIRRVSNWPIVLFICLIILPDIMLMLSWGFIVAAQAYCYCCGSHNLGPVTGVCQEMAQTKWSEHLIEMV